MESHSTKERLSDNQLKGTENILSWFWILDFCVWYNIKNMKEKLAISKHNDA